MNIDVTSVARKDQKLWKTPAAVYVITQEEIQRSGATTIPDLLRMAPGVQVAQVEPDRWAISVRGFNGLYSNKLLVLVDGRTVYTPSFSGVYWDQIDLPLDTIERIEVIRGPGGAVWGANAVNGVINIITMSARDTKGTKVTAGAGSEQTAGYQARFGGKIGDSSAYRIYGGYSAFGSLPTHDGWNLNNGWDIEHGAFRLDQKLSATDSLMVEGTGYSTNGNLDERAFAGTAPVTAELANHGFDVTGRWTRTHSERSQSSLQVSETNYSRRDTGMSENLHTLDLDFQNQFQAGSKNNVVWGGGYRFTGDNIFPSNPGSQLQGLAIQLIPPARNYSLFSAFAQDEISLSDKLALTAGSRFEHNAFTAFEYEPSARLAWTLTDSSTLWTAVSRAVRQPSRMETALDLHYPPVPIASDTAIAMQELGNSQLHPETLLDYEAGYRMMPNNRISFDIATFYSLYDHLEDLALANPGISFASNGAILNLPFEYQNGRKARDYGAEGTLTWNIVPRWKVTGTYSWLRSNVYFPADAAASNLGALGSLLPPSLLESLQAQFSSAAASASTLPMSGTAPEHQFGIQSYFNVSSRISFDNSLYRVGRLNAFAVPAYLRVDARLGYKVAGGIQLSLVGQNLASPQHIEFGDSGQATVASQIPRSVFGSVTWSF